MNDNLTLYNAVRDVPVEAQKEIKGGRLSGMTDINPMWRINILTEQFGPCGVGWLYKCLDKNIIEAPDEQKMAYVDIELKVKINGEWSEPIFGTGGSMFVVKEQRGLHVNDECFKMALTDAISVACKSLGIGADIYWQKDKTKYNGTTYKTAQEVFMSPEDEAAILGQEPPQPTGTKADQVKTECEVCGTEMTQAQLTISNKKYGKALCPACQKKEGN